MMQPREAERIAAVRHAMRMLISDCEKGYAEPNGVASRVGAMLVMLEGFDCSVQSLPLTGEEQT